MDESTTKLQQECLNRLKNWPRYRRQVICDGDRLEYNGMVIEQTIGKDRFQNDTTVYNITMDGSLVPTNRDIDLACLGLYRRYLKMNIVKRENTKAAIIGGSCFLVCYMAALAAFTFIFNKCSDGKVPVIDDDYGRYMMSKNNSTNQKNKVIYWFVAENMAKRM